LFLGRHEREGRKQALERIRRPGIAYNLTDTIWIAAGRQAGLNKSFS